jgi:hypothetical protein
LWDQRGTSFATRRTRIGERFDPDAGAPEDRRLAPPSRFATGPRVNGRGDPRCWDGSGSLVSDSATRQAGVELNPWAEPADPDVLLSAVRIVPALAATARRRSRRRTPSGSRRPSLASANAPAAAVAAAPCFGANDAAPWKRVPPEEFDANYQQLVGRARSPSVLMLGPAPVIESDAPGGRTNGEASRYSAIAADVAERCDVLLASLFDALGADDLADEPVHLNDDGYDTIERLVVGLIGHSDASSSHAR